MRSWRNWTNLSSRTILFLKTRTGSRQWHKRYLNETNTDTISRSRCCDHMMDCRYVFNTEEDLLLQATLLRAGSTESGCIWLGANAASMVFSIKLRH